MTSPLPPSSHARLFVLLPESSDPAAALHWFNPDSRQSGHTPLAGLPASERLTLLLAPPQLNTHALKLPRQPAHKLLPLLRQTLEDRTLGKADTLHLSHRQDKDGLTRLHACDKAWLAGWLGRFADAQRPVFAAHALTDYLPAGDEAVWLALPHGGVLRNAAGESAWFDDAAIARACAGGDTEPAQTDWQTALTSNGSNPIALLHGDIRPRNPARSVDWRLLRRPLLLLALLAGATYLVALAQWWQGRNAVTNLQREIRQSYAAAFPGEPIVDPTLQIASKLRAAGISQNGSQGQRLSDWLQRLETTLDAGVQFTELSWNNNELKLTLGNGDAQAAVGKLNAAGFKAVLDTKSGKPVLTLSEKAR
ncbi:type II secretion system protein L [Andreprevotia lacus DSM 23236]|jgi:type II secretion system protein L|uniref:Type II secretion system protein L n=1 Tax=Andreprevotia lacus DSM 23236 TaxID=1121001 RepID=A0A1W1XLM1_9NEIS|nr:type II secretion system protein GspL [Andreprevotia lacus]SMC24734.1 type II secretion system protein L [Andreprevotia lacus DSM 23236]